MCDESACNPSTPSLWVLGIEAILWQARAPSEQLSEILFQGESERVRERARARARELERKKGKKGGRKER